MNTVLRTSVVALLAVCPAAAQTQPAGKNIEPPGGASRASSLNYYPLQVGTKWHYLLDFENGQKIQLTSQISGVDQVDGKPLARLEVFANGQKLGATEHLQATKEGVFRVRMNDVDLTPPIRLIKYPIKPGQTWGAEMSVGGRKMRVECSEGKAEDVQVPAGKYRAIPCTIVVSDQNEKSKTIFWFAEDVGIVKQRSEAGAQVVTMELTKYEKAE